MCGFVVVVVCVGLWVCVMFVVILCNVKGVCDVDYEVISDF